jgi:hypothetical protein
VRFVRRQRISDESLIEAIERARRGMIDADLGGGIIKQRVARKGQGKSGGYRMLVCYKAGNRAVFLYGFAKNERDDIDPAELVTLREIGAAWLAARIDKIDQALASGTLEEVKNESDNPKKF